MIFESKKKLNEGTSLSINGNREVVLGFNDFPYLVDKYMGSEAKEIFDAIISNYKEYMSAVELAVDEYKGDISKLEGEIHNLRYLYDIIGWGIHKWN